MSTTLRSRLRAQAVDFRRHLQQRWYLYAPVFAIWALAYLRLFVDPTPRVPVLFSWTESLPSRVAVVHYGAHELKRGDHVVFAFEGEAGVRYPGLASQPFYKIVRGVPGDRVDVNDRVVAINGAPVGVAKTHARDGYRLEPIAPVVIPAGHYYVQGTSPDSFDSRYRASGLVRADRIVAVVTPLF